MNVVSLLLRAAELFPENTAWEWEGRPLSYRQLRERTLAVARQLTRLGIGTGDRISILSSNTPLFLESYFAAAACGAILNPINTRLAPAEVSGILRDAEPRALIAGAGFLPLAREGMRSTGVGNLIAEEADDGGSRTIPYGELLGSPAPLDAIPEDPPGAHLYYTSGTTGEPRGVLLSHANVVHHAVSAIAEFQLDEGDVWAHLAPLYHLADAWATFAVTAVGGRHVLFPAFDASLVADDLVCSGVTITNLVPTMLMDLLDGPARARLGSGRFRLILSGGAPIPSERVREIATAFGCDYAQTYGLTETSPYLTVSLPTRAVQALGPDQKWRYAARTGRPFLGVEVRVVDDSLEDVPRDDRHVGEIVARGPTVFAGYWRKPQETERAFDRGWFRTGDLAVVDERGYLDIVDRKKDMVLTGGENVYSIEVENVLYAHAAVLRAAVFGVPHPKWGEAIVAAVTLRGDADESSLIDHCRASLAAFKCPKRIRILEELPLTGSGKIAKRKLRERYRDEFRAA